MWNEIDKPEKVISIFAKKSIISPKWKTPADKLNEKVRNRLWLAMEKATTTNITEWKKLIEDRKASLNSDNEEEIIIEKLHLEISEENRNTYFNNFLNKYYKDELQFYDEKMQSTYVEIFRYIWELMFHIATDTEYWKAIVKYEKMLWCLKKTKFKADVWIYFFLRNDYWASELVFREIKDCFLTWYKEDKENNKVGLLLAKYIWDFMPIIYSLSKDIPIFSDPNEEMDED